jgi:putative peptidoglycan lipid II flippase
MVKRFWNFIAKEVGGLHEAAYLLAFFSVLSTILAFLRDHLLAHYFGESHALDLYYAAFRIPDFIYALIGSIVAGGVIVPFLLEQLDKSEKDAKALIDGVFSAFFFIIGLTGIIAWIFAPYLMKVFFPSLAFAGPATKTLAPDFGTLVSMTRIMLLSPVFLGFSNFFSSITQIYKRYIIYSISPLLYNVGIIFGTVVLYPRIGLAGLAWGVALGAFMHMALQLPFVWGRSLFPKLTFSFRAGIIRDVILTSFPRTVTVSSNEIAEFFLIVMAGGLSSGAISAFNFSWNLQSVPLAVIGTSYALAAFPVLTRHFVDGNTKRFVEQMVISTKHIIFWSFPVMVLFIVLRAQIVRVILGSGAFTWSDTRLTAAALALFSISLIPQSLVALFVRAYYSRTNTAKPLLMNVLSAALIIIFSFELLRLFSESAFFRYFIEALFRVDDVPGTVMLMLPLGYSLGMIVNTVLHWVAFEKDFPGYTRSVARSAFEIFGVSVIMGGVTYLALQFLAPLFGLSKIYLTNAPSTIGTTASVFLEGFIAGDIGIIVGIGLLYCFGNREFFDVVNAFRNRIWKRFFSKTVIVPPDPSGA